jgi:hypothetical protein
MIIRFKNVCEYDIVIVNVKDDDQDSWAPKNTKIQDVY